MSRAKTYGLALALLASFVVMLTVTPALAMMLFAKASPKRVEPLPLRWLRRGYAAALSRAIRDSQT